MLKVQIDNIRGYIIFKCPECGGEDTCYINTPTMCWKCGAPYGFDIESLKKDEEERVIFHFNEGRV